VSSPDGNELTLAIVGKGEMFGEIALLDRKERTADATALTACRVAILERRKILSFLERCPGALLRIVDLLCSRLRRTDQQIAELALLPVPARLAKALLRLTTTDGCAGNISAGRPIQLSQRELGATVAASRESTNKCLRAWQSKGVVLIKRGFVTIMDRPALEELAEMARPQWHCRRACEQTRRGSIGQVEPRRSWRGAPSPRPTAAARPDILASIMADSGIGNRTIETIGRS
jgi:CRP/FNR family transcriptional regulator, cyclic AMP receptor protein